MRVELQNQLRSAPQTEMRTLLTTHLSQEVIELLVTNSAEVASRKKEGKTNGMKR